MTFRPSSMKCIQDASSSYLLQMRGSAEDTIPAENVELNERETWNPEEGEQKISFITAGDSARPSCFCSARRPSPPFGSHSGSFTEKLASHHSSAQHSSLPSLFIFLKVKPTILPAIPPNLSLHLACHSSNPPSTGLPQGLCTCSLYLAHSFTFLGPLLRCHLSEMLSSPPPSFSIPPPGFIFLESTQHYLTYYLYMYLFSASLPLPHSSVDSVRSGFWFCSRLYSQYLELSKYIFE